ncbi:MAG TPA: sigma-70 family RNA polymerase sigma factor [Gaiellaceae bacterium]
MPTVGTRLGFGQAGAIEAADGREQASVGARAELAFDSDSRDWLDRLTGEGRQRDEAIGALLALLLGAACFVLARRRAQVSTFPREELDDLAVEAAGEALVKILARLDEYRGESRFTTWAWKFAFYEASEAIRRRSWMGREIPTEETGWSVLSREVSPERSLEQRELLDALKSGIERELTPHQRTVFVALALNAVPVDVLAERMGSTRGALYKTLHDARQRLRAHLAA